MDNARGDKLFAKEVNLGVGETPKGKESVVEQVGVLKRMAAGS